MSEQTDSAVNVLRAYVCEMNKWERQCVKLQEKVLRGEFSFTDMQHVAMKEYQTLFDDYCACSSRRNFTFSQPPEYDPDRLTINSIDVVKDDELHVTTTEESAMPSQYVYVARRIDSAWKLCQRYRLSITGEYVDATL